PLGAGSALETLRTRAEGLVGRLERVTSLSQDAQQVGSSLDGVKRQVANHRAQGLQLAEEGGNPDHFLGQGDQAHGNALSAVRAECQKRRGELESRGRRVQEYLRQHDPIVGEMARSSLDAALRAQEQVLAQFEESRPDWPAVRQGLAQALEEFAIAQT